MHPEFGHARILGGTEGRNSAVGVGQWVGVLRRLRDWAERDELRVPSMSVTGVALVIVQARNASGVTGERDFAWSSFTDGEIVRIEVYVDRSEALEAVGLSE